MKYLKKAYGLAKEVFDIATTVIILGWLLGFGAFFGAVTALRLHQFLSQ